MIENNIITAPNGIEIDDLKKSLNIQGEEITFDRKNNILFSETKSVIKDKNQNKISSKGFEYKTKEDNFRIFEALMQDKDKNTFEIKSAYIDTRSNILVGENIIVNLNNIYFNENNEPRLKGKNKTSIIQLKFLKVFLLHVKKLIAVHLGNYLQKK